MKKPPTPTQIKSKRQNLNLTQKQCADLIGMSLKAWQAWEQGVNQMHPTFWAFFLQESKKTTEKGKTTNP